MSDPPRGAAKPEDPDIDELPSESTPQPPGGTLSLADEIAALTDLEIEEEKDGAASS